jgi:hypothetical protein
MKDLPLEVGEVHAVGIYDAQFADPTGGQVKKGGTPQAAKTDHEYTALEEPQLPCFPEFRKQKITLIDRPFEIGQVTLLRRHKKNRFPRAGNGLQRPQSKRPFWTTISLRWHYPDQVIRV